MSLDDRDYYRELIRMRLGFGPNPWNKPKVASSQSWDDAHKAKKRLQQVIDNARVAPGMTEQEVEVIVTPRRCPRWLIVACLLMALMPWAWLATPYYPDIVETVIRYYHTVWPMQPTQHPMPRVIYGH
jgi:hypothetical protein